MTNYSLTRKKTEEDYYSLAESRGFEWVGDSIPISINVKTLWHCFQGHDWLARYNDIQQGHGCPYCQDYVNGVPTSGIQTQIYNLIQEYDPDLEWVINYPVGKL